MKQCFYLILIGSFLFFSCNKPHNNIEPDISDVKTIIVDTKQELVLPLDSIFHKIEFIKLETTNENLIGKISQLFFIDSLIIAVDAESSKTICFFDRRGNYLHRIKDLGQGPHEYVEISHVSIVPGNKQLVVIDRPQNKVIYYDLNGKFVKSERTPFMLSYFEFLESGSKAYKINGMNDSQIGEYRNNPFVVTDKNNNIIYGAFQDINTENFSFSKLYPLRKFQETVYFSPNFSSTIYEVSDTIVKAKYQIDFKQYKMPGLSNDITDKQFKEYREKYFYFNGDFIELKDFSYINVATPCGFLTVIYSHKQNKTVLHTGNGNHPFFSFLNIPKARYEDNAIVVDVQAYIIHALKNEFYKNGKFNELLDSLFENLDEDANPVLFLYYLNPDL